jgi:hypothetical protein
MARSKQELPLGFIDRPKRHAAGGFFQGRFVCHEVQWTAEGRDLLATFTITAEELTAAADNRLLWTDQDVQRGIQPGVVPRPARELPVAEGYPDPKLYIFDAKKADDIAEKLLRGERLFLNPLVWNLRPASFEAYAAKEERDVYIYNGRVYLPDSHHRHQAIIKALRAWREAPNSYPQFSGEQQFKIELYFLSKIDEGNYFFDKNQLPKPTALSKAYDLTTLDDLSTLAKRVVQKSVALRDNVNRVTDRLSARNAQVVTLSTLREMMRTFAGTDTLDENELEGRATVAAKFYDMLSRVRPELAHLPLAERSVVRADLISDSGVMMHGYAALMRDFNDAIVRRGIRAATAEWETTLARFSPTNRYTLGRWSGDLFEKSNPLWLRLGIVKPSKDGKSLTVLNTGSARGETGRVLSQLAAVGKGQHDLKFLLKR